MSHSYFPSLFLSLPSFSSPSSSLKSLSAYATNGSWSRSCFTTFVAWATPSPRTTAWDYPGYTFAQERCVKRKRESERRKWENVNWFFSYLFSRLPFLFLSTLYESFLAFLFLLFLTMLLSCRRWRYDDRLSVFSRILYRELARNKRQPMRTTSVSGLSVLSLLFVWKVQMSMFPQSRSFLISEKSSV